MLLRLPFPPFSDLRKKRGPLFFGEPRPFGMNDYSAFLVPRLSSVAFFCAS